MQCRDCSRTCLNFDRAGEGLLTDLHAPRYVSRDCAQQRMAPDPDLPHLGEILDLVPIQRMHLRAAIPMRR